MVKEKQDIEIAKEEKEFNRTKWLFATGGIGRDMVYCLVSSYFFIYVQFGLTLSAAQFATLSILIGVLGRIWDGINDPIMGTIIDGAKLKWGKFKPWIFIGAILTGVLLLVLFNVRPFGTQDVYGWIYVGLMVVIYLLWEAAFTMNDIGYWGAIPSLSRDRRKRDKLTALVILCAGIGSGIISIVVGAFSPGNILNAYTIYSIVACAALIICQSMVVFTVKEGPRDDEKVEEEASLKKTFRIIFKNKQILWISLGLLIYDIGSGILGALIYNLYYLEYGYDGTFVLVFIGMGVVNMILQAFYPKITKRLTRKQVQFISLILMIVGYAIIAVLGWTPILPFNPWTLTVGYAILGVGGTYFYIASLINMTNCVEYNEYVTGERNEAVISAIRPLIVKFGSATKSLLTTVILIGSGLYVLSQQISNLETQKSLLNDKVTKEVSSETIDNLIFYVDKINEYSLTLQQYEVGSEEYTEQIKFIDNDILTLDNDTLKKVQTRAEYLSVYQQMYILKYNESELVDFSQIANITDSSAFFENGYRYEATFVFSYVDENGEEVNINLANDVYKSHDSLNTRIFLRVMVTIVPIAITFISYYIQNKKFIVNEEYYENMMAEIKARKEQENN